MSDTETAAPTLSAQDALAALDWLVAMGADEALSDTPIDRLEASERQQKAATERRAAAMQTRSGKQQQRPSSAPHAVPKRPAGVTTTRGSLAEAQQAAATANTLADLHTNLAAFDGGTLKRGAKSCVFADGSETPDLMVIGEAPGADEDREGLPFVGVSGQLLDKMLAAIGMARSNTVRMTNVVPWRPLGNRTPDRETIALFEPFLIRHIELARPKMVLTVGKVPTSTLTGKDDAMSRLRGRKMDLSCQSHSCALIATYHPDYLLRTPESKSFAWRDLLLARKTLKEMGCALP